MASEICVLCGGELKGKMILGHHLSYEPEIVIYLCNKCHLFVHLFPFFNEEQIEKVRRWGFQYSDQWKDGTKKYLKSNLFKEVQRKYRMSEKGKQTRSEHRKTKKYKDKQIQRVNRWQEKNKDRVAEYQKRYLGKFNAKKDDETLNLFSNIIATS